MQLHEVFLRGKILCTRPHFSKLESAKVESVSRGVFEVRTDDRDVLSSRSITCRVRLSLFQEMIVGFYEVFAMILFKRLFLDLG